MNLKVAVGETGNMGDVVERKIYDREQINLIVQTTSSCNLRCKHCYESDGHYLNKIMDNSTLSTLILKFSQQYKRVSICWFGGEPLLAGLDFFKNVIFFEKECKDRLGTEFRNSIQTNGTQLTEEMVEFFKKYNFRISFSYDCSFNNVLRTDTEKTLNAIKLCLKHGLSIGIISMIFKDNCDFDSQKKMIEECKSLGVSYKFNRIFSEGAAIINDKYLVSDETYNENQKKLFIDWLYSDDETVPQNINIILNALYDINGRECVYNGCMFRWLSISPDGDIFSCPRFINSDKKIVNIHNVVNVKDIFLMDNYISLVKEANVRIKKCSKECNVFKYCRGGCNAQAYYTNGLDDSNTDLCNYTKFIFPIIATELYFAMNNNKRVNPYVKNIFKKYEDRVKTAYETLKQYNE